MAVTKKTTKTAPEKAAPVVTSKTEQATEKAAKKAANAPKPVAKEPKKVGPKKDAAAKTAEAAAKRATDLATGKAKPRSGEQIKIDSMKPALLAKLKQDSENRSAQLMETELVKIDPADAKIPLDIHPVNAALRDVPDGVIEFEVEGTSLRLLGMADPNATPTLAQRVAIARRLIEVGPRLPKYVKTIEAKQPDFSNAEIKVKRGEDKPTTPPSNKAGNGKTDSAPASTIPNGVPLKKICADINVDPKLARRILRSKGKKPGGRWEWEQKEVEGVKKLLTEEAKKLAASEK